MPSHVSYCDTAGARAVTGTVLLRSYKVSHAVCIHEGVSRSMLQIKLLTRTSTACVLPHVLHDQPSGCVLVILFYTSELQVYCAIKRVIALNVLSHAEVTAINALFKPVSNQLTIMRRRTTRKLPKYPKQQNHQIQNIRQDPQTPVYDLPSHVPFHTPIPINAPTTPSQERIQSVRYTIGLVTFDSISLIRPPCDADSSAARLVNDLI